MSTCGMTHYEGCPCHEARRNAELDKLRNENARLVKLLEAALGYPAAVPKVPTINKECLENWHEECAHAAKMLNLAKINMQSGKVGTAEVFLVSAKGAMHVARENLNKVFDNQEGT